MLETILNINLHPFVGGAIIVLCIIAWVIHRKRLKKNREMKDRMGKLLKEMYDACLSDCSNMLATTPRIAREIKRISKKYRIPLSSLKVDNDYLEKCCRHAATRFPLIKRNMREANQMEAINPDSDWRFGDNNDNILLTDDSEPLEIDRQIIRNQPQNEVPEGLKNLFDDLDVPPADGGHEIELTE
jgi:hypothetical protein